jgi:hypothetical protein
LNGAICGLTLPRPRGARLAGALTWALVAAWAAWALVRVLGLETGWPLAAMLAFTPYVALTAFIPLGVAVAVRRWAAAAIAALVLVALAALVLPRAFGGPTEAEGAAGPTLRVLGANMRLGHGEPDALVELVRELDVDVLSVEELTPKLGRELDAAGLSELMPNRELRTGASALGGGLYTRSGLLGRIHLRSLGDGFPLISGELRIPGAPPVEAVSVHTAPPVHGFSWESDIEGLPATADVPLRILLGDFNATLDQEAFRDLLDRGYADAGSTLGDGLTPTWPTNRVFPPLVTIDHVLADERIGIDDYSVHDIPGSDHRAVFAELTLPAAP